MKNNIHFKKYNTHFKTVDPAGEAYEFLSGGCGSAWEVDAGEMMLFNNGASTSSAFWINSFEWNDNTER